MGGLLIQYTYDGNEDDWRAAIQGFIASIKSDPKLQGKFSYLVVRSKEDPTRRFHIPRWSDEETLAHLQSQPWFGEFAGKVKAFAGDSLQTTPLTSEFDTGD